MKIYVTAAPTDGEANEAVIALLAKTLGVAKGRITVVRGHTSRTKEMTVEGIADDDARNRLMGSG